VIATSDLAPANTPPVEMDTGEQSHRSPAALKYS